MKDLKKEEKILEDPSQIYRPDVPDYEEKTKDFRNYGEDNALFDRVKKTYLDMHTNQTVEYVQAMHKKVCINSAHPLGQSDIVGDKIILATFWSPFRPQYPSPTSMVEQYDYILTCI